jgi:hypothetical protein
MTECTACGAPVDSSETSPSLRSGSASYHVSCAPPSLLEEASEEYRAILRKGVRYFVEKHSGPLPPTSDVGARFLALGHAIESERDRRSPSRP